MQRRIWLSIALVIAGWSTAWNAHAGSVVIDGREWFQPIDVVGYSWNDFDTVCGAGTCNGLLGGAGPDLTGWRWASIFEVGELFAANSPHPGGIAEYQTAQIAPGVDFFTDSGLTVTTDIFLAINFGVSAIFGLSSTLLPTADSAYAGYVQIGLFPGTFQGTRIGTDEAVSLDEAQPYIGAWLYRDNDVPVPATAVLVLLGLAGLGWSRRSVG